MFRRAWRAILIASVGAWAALSPALAPVGSGSALAQDPCSTPDANLDLNVAAGSESVAPGDPITLTLDVSNLTSPINGAQALIHFDNSVLTLIGITPNGGQGWADFRESETGGDITYIVSIFSSDVQADHTIATVRAGRTAPGFSQAWDRLSVGRVRPAEATVTTMSSTQPMTTPAATSARRR